MRLVWPLIFAVILLLGSGGYVSLANTLIGEQVAEVVEGRIIEKSLIGKSRGRRGSPILDIETRRVVLLDTIRIPVTRREYDELNVGDFYSRTMIRGGLGILYEKRW